MDIAQENRKFKIYKITHCLFYIVLSICFPIVTSSMVFNENVLPLWLMIISFGVAVVSLIPHAIYYFKLDKLLREKFDKTINRHELLFWALLILTFASPANLFAIVAISIRVIGGAPLPIHALIVCYLIILLLWTIYIIKILKLELTKSD